MPTPKDPLGPRDVEGFDVVCTVGRVEFDPHGDTPSHVVAFRLVAEHNAEGHYHFPMVDGRTCHLTVEWSGDPGEVA